MQTHDGWYGLTSCHDQSKNYHLLTNFYEMMSCLHVMNHDLMNHDLMSYRYEMNHRACRHRDEKPYRL